MYLILNGHEVPVSSVSELRAQLKSLKPRTLYEVDLSTDDQEPDHNFFGLIMLVHDRRAFLTYFRYEGDTGLNSSDPSYTGSREATLDFRFSNGEVDPYPVWWTIPIGDACAAMEHTFLHGEPALFVTWWA